MTKEPTAPIILMLEDAMADNADLGDHLEDYVSRLVESGRYSSRRDVLREGVRLVEERESRLATLDAALFRGLADAEAGRSAPASAVAERLTSKYAQR
jgi:antitoxin ParD1/3/4